MKPPRVFVDALADQGSPGGSLLSLSTADSHHLRDVLRLTVGAKVEVCCASQGIPLIAHVHSVAPIVTLMIPPTEKVDMPLSRPLHPQIILIVGLCKGQKNELIIDWATELGCRAVFFWESAHSVVRLRNEEERAAKVARYHKIGLAAAKQSRSIAPPTLGISQNLQHALFAADQIDTSATPLRLLCALNDAAQPVSTIKKKADAVQIVIGPEGHISQEEELLLCSAGFIPITLGRQVLRSELAAVTAIVTVQHTFGHEMPSL